MDERACANCHEPVSATPRRGNRGPDIAWMHHCTSCAALVEDQMELVEDRPDGQPIQILRCRSCGCPRACRSGWRTRCHICTDERTNLDHIDQDLIDDLAQDPEIAEVASQMAGTEGILPRNVVEACSFFDVLDLLESRRPPGWTIEAMDVCGLPWHPTDTGRSHGTWARHDACGTVSLVRQGRTACPTCPGAEGSRSHRDLADKPHYLYLVSHRSVVKFGHGTELRVRAHLNVGAEVRQVLRARHHDVVEAEREIKREFRSALRSDRRRLLLPSFGRGTEVLAAGVAPDLSRFLDGEDVTHHFREPGARSERPATPPAVEEYRAFSGAVPPMAGRAATLVGVLAIVADEGPVVGARIQRVLATASGRSRVGARRLRDVNAVLAAAVRRGSLIQDSPLGERLLVDRTYRLPHQPPTRVRTLGPREFTQVPPRELAAVLATARATHPDGPQAARAAAAHYGIARLGRTVQGRIEAVRALHEPNRV